MAGKRPRLTLWIDDFEAHLFRSGEPTLATGTRIRLWCRAYRRGGTLPTDDATLAQWSGLSRKEWETVKPFLAQSWEQDGDVYILRRVREELGFRDRASELAKQAADARWSKEQDAETMRDASLTHAESMRDASNPQCGNDAPHSPPSPTPLHSTPSRSAHSPRGRARDPDPRDFTAGYHPDFLRFWDAYPVKANKGVAWRAWQGAGVSPPIDAVLGAIAWQLSSPKWQDQDGRFIPDPANWLRARAWEDEPSGYERNGTKRGTGADAAIREILADRNFGRPAPALRELPAPDDDA